MCSKMPRFLADRSRLGATKNKLLCVTTQIHKSEARSSASCSDKDKSTRKTFNTPHPPKDPPENYNPSSVEHESFDVPEFIPAAVFRPFTSKSERLGPGADKRSVYKNPEYYSYHRYSFVALQLACLALRAQVNKQGNARGLYECEDSGEEKCSSDEEKK